MASERGENQPTKLYGNIAFKAGCQMIYFQAKNSNLGTFWRVLQWKMLVYCILQPFEIFYGDLVYFVVIWYIFPRFDILYLEKSGNLASRLGRVASQVSLVFNRRIPAFT
jgi:hypothetical protein